MLLAGVDSLLMLITSSAEVKEIRKEIRCYESMSGAKINLEVGGFAVWFVEGLSPYQLLQLAMQDIQFGLVLISTWKKLWPLPEFGNGRGSP